MSANSPEIDCNCDSTRKFEDRQGHTIKRCIDCGREYRLVANGPDDCEWEEVES